jgi:hypothetical protein
MRELVPYTRYKIITARRAINHFDNLMFPAEVQLLSGRRREPSQ